MRSLVALLVAGGTLMPAGGAMARDMRLPKTDAAALQKMCTEIGGAFSQGTARYGCGTDCKGGAGTDCVVTCEPDKPCVAQVIGGRRPHSVAQALAPGKKR